MTAWIAIAVLLAAVVAAFAAGWQAQGWRWRAADADRLETQRESERIAARVVDQAAGAHEVERAAIRIQREVVTREVDRIVDRPVYRDGVCLDADGLRLVAAAVGPGSAASQPAPGLPASAAAR